MLRPGFIGTISLLLLMSCVPQGVDRRSLGVMELPLESPGTSSDSKPAVPLLEQGALTLQEVYLAQTHVLPAKNAGNRLVAQRETLLKVDLTSRESDLASPEVSVELLLEGRSTTAKLVGPKQLPATWDGRKQSFDDSFTVILPKEWIVPGLKLNLRAGDLFYEIQTQVGAPNPLPMSLLRFYVFRAVNPPVEPSSWESELEAKLPVSKLTIRRLAPFLLREVVVPPRRDVGLPAVRVNSSEAYRTKTGQNFDGEQALILGLTNALQVAGGMNRLSVFYGFAAGVGVGGGLADPFTAMGPEGNLAVLIHELGHTLSLPHWAGHAQYPYQSDIGSLKGDPGHVGLTWGFDSRKGEGPEGIRLPYFIPPTVQANAVGRTPGVLKKDPMAGGGSGDQEKGFVFRMFSDFSVQQMQRFLERELIVWDEDRGTYMRWSEEVKAYAPIESQGVDLPLEQDASVYSLLYTASAVTSEANFVYTPLGPYRSGLIRSFDARQPEDREAARGTYCQPTCDLTLRVTQGGQTIPYIIRGTWKNNADPLDASSLFVGALNLPESKGPITAAELLLTPAVELRGIPANPRVLFSWSKRP